MQTNEIKKIILNSKFKKFIKKISIRHVGGWEEIHLTINNGLQAKNHKKVITYGQPAIRCGCSFCQKWRKLEEKICTFIKKIPRCKYELGIYCSDDGYSTIRTKQIISTSRTHDIRTN